MERYYLQSTRDSRSNQAVSWKIKSGQRKRRSMYQNDLLLRFIRTLILFLLYNFKFLILSVLIFNMKTFCEHKPIKQIKKSKQSLTSKCEQMEIIPLPLFSNFLKKNTFSSPWNGFSLRDNRIYNTKTGNN